LSRRKEEYKQKTDIQSIVRRRAIQLQTICAIKSTENIFKRNIVR
jgi:hypothetical protein